jgi:hypothetical protein
MSYSRFKQRPDAGGSLCFDASQCDGLIGIAERQLFQLRTYAPFSKLDAVGEFYLL